MKIFLDTADLGEIRKYAATGLVDGVTTNPSLAAKTGRDYVDVLQEISGIVPGSVSAEMLATDFDGIMKQGHRFAKIAKNITIKVPLTWEGLKACRALAADDLQVNVTLCFSPIQALMASKAGATYISPFIGRVDDCGADGIELIRDIRDIYDNYEFKTQILAASIRTMTHVREAALSGADVATIPAKVFDQLLNHPLTDKGIAAFSADAQTAGVTIRDA